MRIVWRLAQRFYAARAARAARKAAVLASRAEKFFRRIKGVA